MRPPHDLAGTDGENSSFSSKVMFEGIRSSSEGVGTRMVLNSHTMNDSHRDSLGPPPSGGEQGFKDPHNSSPIILDKTVMQSKMSQLDSEWGSSQGTLSEYASSQKTSDNKPGNVGIIGKKFLGWTGSSKFQINSQDLDDVLYIRSVVVQYPMTILYAFIIFAVLLAASLWAVLEFAMAEENKQKEATEVLAKDLSRFFTNTLNEALFYAYSLSTFATDMPHFQTMAMEAAGWEKIETGTKKRVVSPAHTGNNTKIFDSIAEKVLSYGNARKSVDNIQFAPAAIVTNIYPMGANQGAIGHDLMRDENRIGTSIQTIKTKDMVMSGPLDSVQGGKLMIGRLPIFIDPKFGGIPTSNKTYFPQLEGKDIVEGRNFWGFATVLFQWKTLVNQSSIRDAEHNGYLLNLTKSSTNSNGLTTVSIVLNTTDLNFTSDIVVDVVVPGGLWRLEVGKRGGFTPVWKVPVCIVVGIISLCVAVICWLAMVASRERLKLIRMMLPKKATRYLLRNPGKPYIETFQHVTIFFSDIVGYTNMAGDLSPTEVMTMLNEVYTEFDAVAAKHGVYKVETIGDSYMVVGGAPTRCSAEEAAVSVAKFGLEVLDKMMRFQSSQGFTLQIRAGMSSGPVVAGIVGTTMPRYCFFGDTVNMSSRMESTGVAGKLQTCVKTARLLCYSDHGFKVVQRLKKGIAVKGKGRQKTFFIEEIFERGRNSEVYQVVKDGPDDNEAHAARMKVASENIDIWRTASDEARLEEAQAMQAMRDPNGGFIAGRVALPTDGLSSLTDAHTAWNALQSSPLGQIRGTTPYPYGNLAPGGAASSSLPSEQSLGPLQVEDVVIDSSNVQAPPRHVPTMTAPPSLSGYLPQPQSSAPAYVPQGTSGTTAQLPGVSMQQLDGLQNKTVPSTSLPSFSGSA